MMYDKKALVVQREASNVGKRVGGIRGWPECSGNCSTKASFSERRDLCIARVK
jgi:hypothetical protein